LKFDNLISIFKFQHIDLFKELQVKGAFAVCFATA
jgi:hypothetical protein